MVKRILVTGGAGFIGSFLCEELLNKGHEVLCLDNFFTGQKRNICHLMDNKNFELIRHDIVNPIFLEVEQIYNFACPASPVHYQYNPIKTTKVCVVGTLNMLGLAKRIRARILQASTSEIYGDPLTNPQKESYWGNVNPIGPRSCYDEGKRVAETLMSDYYRQNQVDIKIARIFNTYGPRMVINDGRVVSNFIVQALKNKKITVYGDGTQTRSFCYIDDMIDGLIKMMENEENPINKINSDYTKPSLSGFTGPINLGGTNEITIGDLAEKIIDLINSKSEITYESLPQDDPKRRKPDINLAIERLKWKPKVSIEYGLKMTINYFENLLRNDYP